MTPDTVNRTQNKTSSLTLLSVIATFVGLIPTTYAMLISNSAALFADFLRCTSEFVALLIAYLVIRKSSLADFSRYNYGMGKLEHMASLAVASAMGISFVIITLLLYQRTQQHVTVEGSLFGFIVAVLGVLANGALWIHYQSHLKNSSSPVVLSQVRLFRSKTLATSVVAISLSLTFVPALRPFAGLSDSLGSALIGLFLLYSSYRIVSASMNELIDCSIEEVYQLEILKTLVDMERHYEGFHSIRTRRSGSQTYIEVYLSYAPDLSMREVHLSNELIKEKLLNQFPDSDIIVIASTA